MKIIIEYLEEESESFYKGWMVTNGDKYADGLGYDEMIGLVAAITMPDKRPALQWLQTKEQHHAFRNRYSTISENEGPLMGEDNLPV